MEKLIRKHENRFESVEFERFFLIRNYYAFFASISIEFVEHYAHCVCYLHLVVFYLDLLLVIFLIILKHHKLHWYFQYYILDSFHLYQKHHIFWWKVIIWRFVHINRLKHCFIESMDFNLIFFSVNSFRKPKGHCVSIVTFHQKRQFQKTRNSNMNCRNWNIPIRKCIKKVMRPNQMLLFHGKILWIDHSQLVVCWCGHMNFAVHLQCAAMLAWYSQNQVQQCHRLCHQWLLVPFNSLDHMFQQC